MCHLLATQQFIDTQRKVCHCAQHLQALTTQLTCARSRILSLKRKYKYSNHIATEVEENKTKLLGQQDDPLTYSAEVI